ncbi:uncharacterized protein DUF2630 [Actinocorallia herbida]|uniref:Uncharacterized protein DUF2630 n=1 Tax=Actinocorallia herbida TaxID=58109 RepID=A0A3N1CW69_9ACTN|nr:DUF2630 family protein [Actinocorallia herbida]ROO85533.1 uncharacterized protein DUF2630 [Actinocorallia herbida]
MNDQSILERVHEVLAEEHALRSAPQGGTVHRLRALELELDQCWDLLRRRRALREFGADPSAAQVRPASQVKDYVQ